MTDTKDQPAMTPQPDAALRQLDRLVGTWTLSGETAGTVRYEWMEGGFFLLQHVDLQQSGARNIGLEIIGRERTFGTEAPGEAIKSRFYGSDGSTLDYEYELEGDTLTIWGGAKGSPAYYRGTFNEAGDAMVGTWVWPGGGYSSTMTRVK